MVSVNKNQNQSKKETNPNQPSTSSDTEDPTNPNPNNPVTVESTSSASPLVIEGDEEDTILKKSEYLTREEVIRRRLRRVRQMEKLYKDHYWSLMEELRVKYREYYWEYGKSPFKEEEIRERGENNHSNGGLANGVVVEGSGDNHNNVNGGGGGGSGSGGGKLGLVNGGEDNNDGKYKICVFVGCKSKAMALANHCHQHIILDSRQTLYKSCSYVTKSGNTGTMRCGKTILSSKQPLLCSPHIQKAEKHVTRALRAAGLTNITSSSQLAPKLHIIVAEAVRQINAKRREKRAAMNNVTIEESTHAAVS